MKRAWSQRGKRLLSIHVGLFLLKPDLEKKNTFACSKQIKLAKVIQKSTSWTLSRGKKSEKRSAAFTLRLQKVKTKFTLKKIKAGRWCTISVIWEFGHKNAERFIPYTSAQKQGVGTICCSVIKNVFRNVLTKHLLQSRQQWTNQLRITWTVCNKLKNLSEYNWEEIWSSLMT